MFSALRAKGRFVPTCAAVLTAALLAGCTVREAAPAEPDRFEWTILTREAVMGNARTGIVTDRRTGCLYSFAHERGVAPIVGPDGAHAGCRATTEGEGSSLGMSRQANAPKARPGEQGEEGA